MNVDQARIFIRDKERKELFRYNQEGIREVFPEDCGIAGHVLSTKKYENISNAYNNSLFNGKIDIQTSMPLITWPIPHPRDETDVVGVFEVVNLRGIRGMTHTSKAKLNMFDFETLDFFAKQLSQTYVSNDLYEKLNTKERKDSQVTSTLE